MKSENWKDYKHSFKKIWQAGIFFYYYRENGTKVFLSDPRHHLSPTKFSFMARQIITDKLKYQLKKVNDNKIYHKIIFLLFFRFSFMHDLIYATSLDMGLLVLVE